MFFLAVGDLSHCSYHTWLAFLLKGQTILSLSSWENSLPCLWYYVCNILTWKWWCGSLGCNCWSTLCPDLEDAREEMSGGIQEWRITIAHRFSTGGSRALLSILGVHPWHLHGQSTNFGILVQLWSLLQHITIKSQFLCYGDVKCLMSSRRPTMKYLAEI